MKNIRIKTWLKALRSGKFKQTTGRLCRREGTDDTLQGSPAGHCCLGVYAELCKGKKLELHEGARSMPIEEVRDQLQDLGLDRFHLDELVDLNDEQGKSFKQIADYIETELELGK